MCQCRLFTTQPMHFSKKLGGPSENSVTTFTSTFNSCPGNALVLTNKMLSSTGQPKNNTLVCVKWFKAIVIVRVLLPQFATHLLEDQILDIYC